MGALIAITGGNLAALAWVLWEVSQAPLIPDPKDQP